MKLFLFLAILACNYTFSEVDRYSETEFYGNWYEKQISTGDFGYNRAHYNKGLFRVQLVAGSDTVRDDITQGGETRTFFAKANLMAGVNVRYIKSGRVFWDFGYNFSFLDLRNVEFFTRDNKTVVNQFAYIGPTFNLNSMYLKLWAWYGFDHFFQLNLDNSNMEPVKYNPVYASLELSHPFVFYKSVLGEIYYRYSHAITDTSNSIKNVSGHRHNVGIVIRLNQKSSLGILVEDEFSLIENDITTKKRHVFRIMPFMMF